MLAGAECLADRASRELAVASRKREKKTGRRRREKQEKEKTADDRRDGGFRSGYVSAVRRRLFVVVSRFSPREARGSSLATKKEARLVFSIYAVSIRPLYTLFFFRFRTCLFIVDFEKRSTKSKET